MVAWAAASESVSPPNVEKKKTSFSRSDITSARPVRIERGIPLATAFEKQARSAVTPKCSCAPPRASRKPVHISSNTRRAPRSVHSRRSPSRKPRRGSSNVMGSRITHAVSSSRPSATDSRSL